MNVDEARAVSFDVPQAPDAWFSIPIQIKEKYPELGRAAVEVWDQLLTECRGKTVTVHKYVLEVITGLQSYNRYAPDEAAFFGAARDDVNWVVFMTSLLNSDDVVINAVREHFRWWTQKGFEQG